MPIWISIVRNGDQIVSYDTFINGTSEYWELDKQFVRLIVKFLLWKEGGYKVEIYGSEEMAEYIRHCYSIGGEREFDKLFMENVYGEKFEVLSGEYGKGRPSLSNSLTLGGNLDGNRIGLDAGGSDIKVSALIEGKTVHSEEFIWLPKLNADPAYHYEKILSAMKKAASHLPSVDAIGISSAGVHVDGQTRVASLFIQVPEQQFNAHAKDLFMRAAKEIADVPVVLINDGGVAALAGAMSLETHSVLGLAMGTSLAAGYVDKNGNLSDCLDELAFAPVDVNRAASRDVWSGDTGVGCQYFSQDAVIRLCAKAGIALDDSATLAEKLVAVQDLMSRGDERAQKIYLTIGSYLGHTLAFYARFYEIKHVLLLGRVLSGVGGNIIKKTAESVLQDSYPEIWNFSLHLPDEKLRRVGQSVAAASLPVIV